MNQKQSSAVKWVNNCFFDRYVTKQTEITVRNCTPVYEKTNNVTIMLTYIIPPEERTYVTRTIIYLNHHSISSIMSQLIYDPVTWPKTMKSIKIGLLTKKQAMDGQQTNRGDNYCVSIKLGKDFWSIRKTLHYNVFHEIWAKIKDPKCQNKYIRHYSSWMNLIEAQKSKYQW